MIEQRINNLCIVPFFKDAKYQDENRIKRINDRKSMITALVYIGNILAGYLQIILAEAKEGYKVNLF